MFVVQDYLMKWLVGVGISLTSVATVGGFSYVRSVASEVGRQEDAIVRIEGKLDRMVEDVEEIRQEVREIPQGEGMSPNDRRRITQIEEDLACVRGHLSGSRTCPPRSR